VDYKDTLKAKTRWDNIPEASDAYRLLCSAPICSLSCANLKNGKLSVTSVHGTERHSYAFTKNDMAFATISFLDSLTQAELEIFIKMFNKISPEFVLNFEKI
jgi:hypothetical protein